MPIGNQVTLSNNVESKTISVIATAGQTLFTVPGGYRLNHLDVIRNGVKLVETYDFIARDGVSVTLTTPSTVNDIIEFGVTDTIRIADAVNANDDNVYFAGNVNIQGDLNVIGVSTIAGAATSVALATTAYGLTGYPHLTVGSVNSTGIITAISFEGPLTGNATGLAGTPSITVNDAIIQGNLTVNGTTSTLDSVTIITEDNNIGLGTTSTPSNTTANGGGITIFAGAGGDKSITWQNSSDDFTFSHGIDIKGAVETVSTATTTPSGTVGKVVLTCDAQNGTVFTHDLTNGEVGIVSLRNFPVTKNSATTFTIIFNQNSTGTANTTVASGIGTNIFLTPYGVSGFSTSARVAAAGTITVSTVANDVDIISIMVHYNGSGTGTPTNYRVFATNNGGFRLGTIRP